MEEYYTSVIVLNAGGTINMAGNEGKKPSGKVKEIVDNLTVSLKKLNINVIHENIFDRPPDSSNVGVEEIEMIFNTVEKVIKEKSKVEKSLKEKGIKLEKGGIVIAHGTDTMEISSLLLSLHMKLVENNFPIVFTGSHSPIDEETSDAFSNLKKAIFVAKEKFIRKNNLPAGVYVLIGKEIHLASRLTKVFTQPNSDEKYFYSFPFPIGQITGKNKKTNFKIDMDYLRVLFANEINVIDKKQVYKKPFGLVEHLVMDKFSSLNLLDDFLKRYHSYKSNDSSASDHYREYGLLIQGDFSKHPDFKKIVDILKKIDKEEILIYVGSKNVFKKILSLNNDFKYLGLIHKNVSFSKARTKLSWLLKFSIDKKIIMNLMQKNIAGEIYESDKMPEWINYETYPVQKNNDEVIVVYPGIHSLVFRHAIKRIINANQRAKESTGDENNSSKKPHNTQLLTGRLFLYGFGDGHIPTVNESVEDILKNFLAKKFTIKDFEVKNGSIEVLLDKIVGLLFKIPSYLNTFIAYFSNNYRINESILKKEILNIDFEKEQNELYTNIKPEIKKYLSSLEDNPQLKFKNRDNLVSLILNGIKFSVNDTELVKRKNRIENEIKSKSPADFFKFLFEKYPYLCAKRLIKESLMFKSDILKELGYAVDIGIQVFVKSQAVRAQTDTDKYEVGNMLKYIGVHSDAVKGWTTNFVYSKMIKK